ncbi:MAG TPA: hypothetical protein VKA32_06075 [Gammaproteobacteria bacterium]|nr:hypothetical protein [Gammaproteobacteria bacterium]
MTLLVLILSCDHVIAEDAGTQSRIQSLDHLRDRLKNGGGGMRREQLLMEYRRQLRQTESVDPAAGPPPAREDDLTPSDRLRRMRQDMDRRHLQQHRLDYEREQRRQLGD